MVISRVFKCVLFCRVTVTHISFAALQLCSFAALQLCSFSFRGVNGGRSGVFPEREGRILGGSACCLSSFWLSRHHFQRALGRFISARSEVMSKSRQRVRQPWLLTRRGWRYRQPLATSFLPSGSLQRAPAAAANAGFPTFTLICFGLASSRFGMLSISTPF
jgi:hypothetical protein